MSKLRGNRTLTGTWGEIWVDGVLIAELSKIEVKVSANREDMLLCLQELLRKHCSGSERGQEKPGGYIPI